MALPNIGGPPSIDHSYLLTLLGLLFIDVSMIGSFLHGFVLLATKSACSATRLIVLLKVFEQLPFFTVSVTVYVPNAGYVNEVSKEVEVVFAGSPNCHKYSTGPYAGLVFD